MFNVRKCLIVVPPVSNYARWLSKFRLEKKSPGSARDQRVKPRSKFAPAIPKFGPNPGIQRQVDALELSEKELRDPEILEDLEKQFWDADKVQNVIDREKHIHGELQQVFQVMRKQFKDVKLPNMLTWDEKLEVKALHDQDPEKWTVMKLAHSFPANPTIIKKILKTNYKLTPSEINRHDRRVQTNWDALYDGKLDVPDQELKQHLMEFSKRRPTKSRVTKDIALNDAKTEHSDSLNGILKGGGAFSKIYESYKNLKSSENCVDRDRIQEDGPEAIEKGLSMLYNPPKKDTFIIPIAVDHAQLRTSHSMTMDGMKNRLTQEAQSGKQLKKDEERFIQSSAQNQDSQQVLNYTPLIDPIGLAPRAECEDKVNTLGSETTTPVPLNKEVDSLEEFSNHSHCPVEDKNYEDFVKKNVPEGIDIPAESPYKKQELMELKKSLAFARGRSSSEEQDLRKAVMNYVSTSSESYPLEIDIPKDLWKKGALYRVKDRFYTDDGQFLYRVPGLVKE